MAHQYSPRDFLRRASNALLDRYFHERQLLLDVDIADLSETEVERIFEAWQELQPGNRTQVDSDFTTIDLIANEEGLRTILEEARFRGADLEPDFADLDGFHDKVLWAFLEHPEFVDISARFIDADNLPGNYWVRRREGVAAVIPRDDQAGRADLARAISGYFRQKEGRGYACVVEAYRRESRFYFFAYPEDYGKTEIEFEGGQLQRRPQRPAFEVVYVYYPDGALDTFYRGPRKTIGDLQEVFSRVVLMNQLEAPVKNESVYDLDRFKGRGVTFVYDPASGIEDVRVKLLRLSVLGGGTRRITVEASPDREREAIFDLLDDVLDTKAAPGSDDDPRIPLALVNVTRVCLQVQFNKDGRRGRHTKSFYLSYPNACTLKHDGKDAVLRQMLIDSGIEPMTPTAA